MSRWSARRCTVVLPTIVALALGVGACSSGDEVSSDSGAPSSTSSPGAPSSTSSPGAPSSGAPSSTVGNGATNGPVDGTELTWEVSLTSAQRILRQVGPDGAFNYGWNELVGPTTVDGSPAVVQMLGNVDYNLGTGPFFGFVTLEFSPENVLAFRMDGQASQPPGAGNSADSSFQAELTLIGGSGTYAAASGGRGTFTGSRSAELGGEVVGTMTVNVTGL